MVYMYVHVQIHNSVTACLPCGVQSTIAAIVWVVATQWGLCQGRPADCRAFNYMVEEIPRQGRLEGCHRMSAAMHLICGLESA